jgi:hypothetical protein
MPIRCSDEQCACEDSGVLTVSTVIYGDLLQTAPAEASVKISHGPTVSTVIYGGQGDALRFFSAPLRRV